jgi:hypothetical protein
MKSIIFWVVALYSSLEAHYTSEEYCWTSAEVHSVTIQNIVLVKSIVVRTSNPTVVTHVCTFMDVGY